VSQNGLHFVDMKIRISGLPNNYDLIGRTLGRLSRGLLEVAASREVLDGLPCWRCPLV